MNNLRLNEVIKNLTWSYTTDPGACWENCTQQVVRLTATLANGVTIEFTSRNIATEVSP